MYTWADLDAMNKNDGHYAREPRIISRAVYALEEAQDELNFCADLHEAAGTDVTRDNMLLAAAKVLAADNELSNLRRLFHLHPLDFWSAEDAKDQADTLAALR